VPEDSVLPERLNRWPLYTETAVLVCPASHRVARQNACTAPDLEGETLLIGDACGGFDKMLAPACQPRLQNCRGSAANFANSTPPGGR
jgi:DNA-binding transcriptional LysR family regulator